MDLGGAEAERIGWSKKQLSMMLLRLMNGYIHVHGQTCGEKSVGIDKVIRIKLTDRSPSGSSSVSEVISALT